MTKFKTLQELFADRNRWTQWAHARDKDGCRILDEEDENAVCWCLVGGLRLVYHNTKDDKKRSEVMLKLDALAIKMYGHSPMTVNDNLGYEAVMKLVQEAGV